MHNLYDSGEKLNNQIIIQFIYIKKYTGFNFY